MEQSNSEQAGGHAGVMIFEGDHLLKRCKPSEINFYQWLYTPEHNDPSILELKQIVPRFYGVQEREGHSYVTLENLLIGYDHANIMDCKMGKITWTPHHTEKTIAHQEGKNRTTTTGTLGFRITGLIVKDNNGTKTESMVKGYNEITDVNVHEHFAKIVTRDGIVQRELVDEVIGGTARILNWFRSNRVKHFRATSVFYVVGKNGKVQTRYIDFAHPIDANGELDQNVIEGLENLIRTWQRVRENAA